MSVEPKQLLPYRTIEKREVRSASDVVIVASTHLSLPRYVGLSVTEALLRCETHSDCDSDRNEGRRVAALAISFWKSARRYDVPSNSIIGVDQAKNASECAWLTKAKVELRPGWTLRFRARSALMVQKILKISENSAQMSFVHKYSG